MTLAVKSNSFFVFDLDDTLYSEIEFLESAYKFIAQKLLPVTGHNIYVEMLQRYHFKQDVFEWIISRYSQKDINITKARLLDLYRNHEPAISLYEEAEHLLEALKEKNIPVGLITDGRSITQRNKLKSLGLSDYFKEVIISEEFGSEKPDEKNYLLFEKKYPGKEFYFIGDNPSKDFIVPLRLGWVSICIKSRGKNIHLQDSTQRLLPNLIFSSFEELVNTANIPP